MSEDPKNFKYKFPLEYFKHKVPCVLMPAQDIHPRGDPPLLTPEQGREILEELKKLYPEQWKDVK